MTVTTDPGLEVVDLAGDQAPLDAELRDLEAQPVSEFFGNVDMARHTGFADDYEWAPWLADVLRAEGLEVVEYPGWKTRGRPRSAGPFTPRGVTIHHDASAAGPSPAMARFIAEVGRPAEGIPAPLAQLWVALDGTWHVLAAGRANHAGTGDGFRNIGEDMGNSLTFGVETDNTTGEATPKAMYDSLVRGSAAIFRKLGTDPAGWLCGHKEYAAGRKVDPDDVDMPRMRIDVREAIKPSGGHVTEPPKPGKGPKLLPFPGAEHFTVKHKCSEGFVDKLKELLREADPREGTQITGPTYSPATARRVAEFQKGHKRLKSENGKVGPKTWELLQLEAAKAGER